MFQLIFYLTHLPTTFLLSAQQFIPSHLVPAFALSALTWWVDFSGDPFLRPILASSNAQQQPWVWGILAAECTLGALMTLRIVSGGVDNPRTFPLQIAHAAYTATTTFLLLTDLFLPLLRPTDLSHAYNTKVTLTNAQSVMLFFAYAPYLIVPVWIAGRRVRDVTALIVNGGAGRRMKTA
ncbi:hypothetical protein DFJ77DRAFT_478832 [Powellomyces hirtus]|nr:hypothetical protein DFJ77DRAFT_478832 [Powellomyces hirtus]